MGSLARLLAVLAALLAGATAATAQLALPEAPPLPAPAAEPEPSVAEALRLLAIVLDDPEARAAMVEQLRHAERLAAPPEPGVPAPPEEDPTVPQLIAEQTRGFAERASGEVLDVLRGLVDVREIVANARAFDFRAAAEGMLPLLTIIAVTLGAMWFLRGVRRGPVRRLDASAAGASLLMRQAWKAAALAVDLAAVVLAWMIGYGAALALGGGEMLLSQGLFLNAFLIVELIKAGIRAVVRPNHAGLRSFAMGDGTARHWAFWLARIAGFLGYGLLFVVPLAEPATSEAFQTWLRLLIVIAGMVMVVLLVLRNRARVRAAIEERTVGTSAGTLAAVFGVLARIWHLLVIGYVLALFVVWRTHPGDAERFMLEATGRSVVAIVLGAFVVALLTRWIAGGITLSERVRRDLPLLEERLNAFVPAILKAARFVVALVVILSVLTFWGIIDFYGWLATPTGGRVAASFGWIAGILIVAIAGYIVVSSWIEYRLNPDVGRPPTPRERTLLALFSNGFMIVLAVMTAMAVLSEIGINIAPLLAGAGVVGLAIGFGSQKLVQDIINGAFIQFENTMNEGDVVTAGGTTGVVEKLTIRSVSLRDLQGHYHMIPFSGVDTVTNFMKGFSYHVAEIGVAYREDVSEVKQLMHDAFDRLMETEHRANILPPLDMQGVTEFAESAVMVRARIKTLPGQQWAVGRAFNEIIKRVFDAAGVEIPFPHRTIYIGESKRGTSPPLNVRSLDAKGAGSGGTAGAGEGAPPRPDAAGIAPPDSELTPPAEDDVT